MIPYLIIAALVSGFLAYEWMKGGKEYFDAEVLVVCIAIGLLWPITIVPLSYAIHEG